MDKEKTVVKLLELAKRQQELLQQQQKELNLLRKMDHLLGLIDRIARQPNANYMECPVHACERNLNVLATEIEGNT